MAITSNIDLINTYDGNFQVVSSRILPDIAPHNDEHAAQCLAIETLRTLLASGMSVAQYNALTDAEFRAIIDESFKRSKLNVNAPGAILSATDVAAAGNLGGNFFEHGYVFIIDSMGAATKVQFTRIGGL